VLRGDAAAGRSLQIEAVLRKDATTAPTHRQTDVVLMWSYTVWWSGAGLRGQPDRCADVRPG
jgi:hypothetical protein